MSEVKEPIEAPVEDPKVQAPTQETPTQPTPEQVEKVRSETFKYTMGLIDDKLKELGFDKPAGTKTTDFLGSLLKKEESEGTKTASPKVDDSELSAKYKSLQEKYQERESELENLKGSVTKAKRDFWMDSLVASTPIYIPDHLSETEKSRMKLRTEKLIKSELTNNYDIKEVDGQFKFYNKDGQPIFDGTVDMNYISPTELIKKEFSEYLTNKAPEPTKPTGTGTGKEAPKDPKPNPIPSNVKTAGEFYEYLRGQGLTLGSKEFMEKVKLAKEAQPAMFKR